MHTQKIARYEAQLRKERVKLVEDLKKKEVPADFGDDVDDIDAIEAEEAEELGTNLAIGQTLRNRINEIDRSLQRIKEGTYGICTNCGKEISERVLDIAPESELCENCKKK